MAVFIDEQGHKHWSVRITELQAQLAKRDKTISEYQARIEELRYWLEEMQKCAAEENKGLLGTEFALLDKDNLVSLEAALKAERIAGKIEGLEDAVIAIEKYCAGRHFAIDRLTRMANELKEQS